MLNVDVTLSPQSGNDGSKVLPSPLFALLQLCAFAPRKIPWAPPAFSPFSVPPPRNLNPRAAKRTSGVEWSE